jgi:hypothetical protein
LARILIRNALIRNPAAAGAGVPMFHAALFLAIFLAAGAMSKQRKLQRYLGLCEATKKPAHDRPDSAGEIRGGGFIVNATAAFTRSLGEALILPLPRQLDSASVRDECAPLQWARHTPPPPATNPTGSGDGQKRS